MHETRDEAAQCPQGRQLFARLGVQARPQEAKRGRARPDRTKYVPSIRFPVAGGK
jgi:hypothetical protein